MEPQSPPTPSFWQFAWTWIKAHKYPLLTHATAFVAGAILF